MTSAVVLQPLNLALGDPKQLDKVLPAAEETFWVLTVTRHIVSGTLKCG